MDFFFIYTELFYSRRLIWSKNFHNHPALLMYITSSSFEHKQLSIRGINDGGDDGCREEVYPPITVCMMREPPQKIPISFKLACQSFLMLCDLMAVSMMSADPRLCVVTHIDTSSRSVCVQALLRRSPRNQPQ